VHGDFHYGQVRVGSQRIKFIDFDRSHLGSPVADLGNFLAHLHLLELEKKPVDGKKLASRFVNAYLDAAPKKIEHGELNWWIALSLFYLTVAPFRRLDFEWPDKIQDILKTAEEYLC
jgi:aminoglycoside phosphotransferase (APT) family kinase protein